MATKFTKKQLAVMAAASIEGIKPALKSAVIRTKFNAPYARVLESALKAAFEGAEIVVLEDYGDDTFAIVEAAIIAPHRYAPEYRAATAKFKEIDESVQIALFGAVRN